jgi:hypothetical protein
MRSAALAIARAWPDNEAVPDDNEDPPTLPKITATADAMALEARARAHDAESASLLNVATTPAPIDYADMAALLARVPALAIDRDDLAEFRLDDAARAVIAHVDGRASVVEIAGRVDQPNMLSTLIQLEQRGIITLASFGRASDVAAGKSGESGAE